MGHNQYKKYPIPFGDEDDYHQFIINMIYNAKDALFHSVINQNIITTNDGPMLELSLSMDVSNPNFENAAECVVNSRHYFVYKDSVYALANVDGRLAVFYSAESGSKLDHKKIVIYKIGDITR